MISDLHALKYAQILTQNLQLGRRFTEPPTGLALLSNITAAPLTAILEFTLRRQGINARLQNGDYYNILQDAARFPEARVLIHLKLNGSVPVTTAMQVAGTSYRGFYAVLERLKQAGIVATVKDPQDQRVRRLSLDPSIPISHVNR